MKKVIIAGLMAGIVLFIISYGGLYLAIQFFPSLFVEYNNPLFNSTTERDIFFYSHAFVISMALSFFWERFKILIKGNFLLRGIEFGLMYALIALVPVMWITYSSMDVTLMMIISWIAYGTIQAVIAGVLFAKVNP